MFAPISYYIIFFYEMAQLNTDTGIKEGNMSIHIFSHIIISAIVYSENFRNIILYNLYTSDAEKPGR